jgi:hypothetical protein
MLPSPTWPLPEQLREISDYAEIMYRHTGNPLYPMKLWAVYRMHGKLPVEWILHHIDDVFGAALALLDGGRRTPFSDTIAGAFGFEPSSGHYADFGSADDALVGFSVLRRARKAGGISKAVKAVARDCEISEQEVWRAYEWYKKLPGISPDTF